MTTTCLKLKIWAWAATGASPTSNNRNLDATVMGSIPRHTRIWAQPRTKSDYRVGGRSRGLALQRYRHSLPGEGRCQARMGLFSRVVGQEGRVRVAGTVRSLDLSAGRHDRTSS